MSDPQNTHLHKPNEISSNNYDDHVGNERNHRTATNTSAGMTNDAGNRNTSSKKQAPPLGHRLHDGRLPNGQLINYKNTMQSYDHLVTQPQPQQVPPPPSSKIKDPPAVPRRLHDGRLPNGQLIDYKNTMQSYDHLVTQPQPQQLPPFSSGRGADGVFGGDADDVPNVNTFQYDNANRNDIHNVPSSTIYAEAVTGRSLAVEADAEIADPRPHPNRGMYFWLAIIFAVIIACLATGIGVYCGTGNCGTDSNSATSTTTSNTVPTASPIKPNTATATVPTPITNTTTTPTNNTSATPAPSSPPTWNPTQTPVTSPVTESPIADQQLSVACNFLNFTDLKECALATVFGGDAVGNTIPTEIGLLTQLTYLDLSFEQLIGTIPSTLGNLGQLIDLSLNSNQLTGTIPSSLGNLLQLAYLNLDANAQLAGTIPSVLCSLPALAVYIDCANTGIVCTCCRNPNTGDTCRRT